MPVFNSAHDSQLNGFSFWDFLKGMTHFDETKFDYLNKRGLKLLESHARSMKDTPDGQKLQRELKNYKVATGGMTGRPMCDICQVGSVDWLADSMAEAKLWAGVMMGDDVASALSSACATTGKSKPVPS